MRRRTRYLFPTFTLISLVLFVPVCLLWIRSRHGGESVERVDSNWRIVVTSDRGLITILWWDGAFPPPTRSRFAYQGYMYGIPPDESWQRWKHWTAVTGVTNEIETGWRYPVYLGDEHWWNTFGFDAWDIAVKPIPNSMNMHDWISPKWTGRQRGGTLPYWAIAGALLAMPFVAAVRTTRRVLRIRSGRCPNCGYDLRESPERCPECGAVTVLKGNA